MVISYQLTLRHHHTLPSFYSNPFSLMRVHQFSRFPSPPPPYLASTNNCIFKNVKVCTDESLQRATARTLLMTLNVLNETTNAVFMKFNIFIHFFRYVLWILECQLRRIYFVELRSDFCDEILFIYIYHILNLFFHKLRIL